MSPTTSTPVFRISLISMGIAVSSPNFILEDWLKRVRSRRPELQNYSAESAVVRGWSVPLCHGLTRPGSRRSWVPQPALRRETSYRTSLHLTRVGSVGWALAAYAIPRTSQTTRKKWGGSTPGHAETV